MKKCTKCGEELPLTSEYFSLCKIKKSGLSGDCKGCRAKYSKIYWQENKELLCSKKKIYWQENKEDFARKQKIYRQENKEKIAEYHKQYNQVNKEIVHERYLIYYSRNKENICSRGKVYREKNKESVIKRNRAYRQKNKGMYLTHTHKRMARKRNLLSTLTTSQWESAKLHFGNTCSYCGSEKALTRDHHTPLNKGGEYTKDNIIPSCQACNSGKRDNDPSIWYPSQPFYSPEREQKILSYLGYKNGIQQLSLL